MCGALAGDNPNTGLKLYDEQCNQNKYHNNLAVARLVKIANDSVGLGTEAALKDAGWTWVGSTRCPSSLPYCKTGVGDKAIGTLLIEGGTDCE